MRDFNRDSNFGDRHNFFRRSSSRPMHQTTCSKCGNKCEVPFKPTSGKPVYCNACFEGNSMNDSKVYERRNYQRSGYDNKPMHEAICDQCGDKCSLPFQPRGDKPVYCSKCFEGKNDKRRQDFGPSKKPFEEINAKLDRILKLLEPGQTKILARAKAKKTILKLAKKPLNTTKKKKSSLKK